MLPGRKRLAFAHRRLSLPFVRLVLSSGIKHHQLLNKQERVKAPFNTNEEREMTSTTTLRTRLDDQEMNALKAIAKVQDRSVCALVRVAVREFIKQNAQCL